MEKEKSIHSETFYHFIWQHKLYYTTNLQTTDGLPIEVIHPGLLNSDAGPDFFNAKIKIDGILWAGNIEIHLSSSDWKNHSHQNNKAYDNVILHVVEQNTTIVKRSDGSTIPTLIIKPLPHISNQYQQLLQENHTIACHQYIKNLDQLKWINYCDRLVSERLENKCITINQRLSQTNNDWETVFFQLLCRSFGFGINADVFECLGQSVSFKIIAKHSNSLMQIEALLFGQAGFLEDNNEENYYKKLQSEYRFLRSKYKLKNIEKHLWKFLRLRPINFPTIRIAQLAYFLHNNHNTLHLILERDIKDFKNFLQTETSEFWITHYNFEKTSSTKIKKLGNTAIDSILINAVVPILFCYGKNKNLEQFKDKALKLLETISKEKNHITNQWEELGLSVNNAYDSQALIQLYRNYCLHRKCLHCKIGRHYLSLQQ